MNLVWLVDILMMLAHVAYLLFGLYFTCSSIHYSLFDLFCLSHWPSMVQSDRMIEAC